MKRRQLLKYLKKHDCELLREGSRHSVFWNPATHQTTTVPRHTEVINQLAQKICKVPPTGTPTPPRLPQGGG